MASGMGRVCKPSFRADRPPGANRPPQLQTAGQGAATHRPHGSGGHPHGAARDCHRQGQRQPPDRRRQQATERNQGPRDAPLQLDESGGRQATGERKRYGAAMADPAGYAQTSHPHRQGKSPQRERRPFQFPAIQRYYFHAGAARKSVGHEQRLLRPAGRDSYHRAPDCRPHGTAGNVGAVRAAQGNPPPV